MFADPQMHANMPKTEMESLDGGGGGSEFEADTTDLESSMMNSGGNDFCSVRRGAILLVGIMVGFVTFMPNAMMSDSGTKKAGRAASLGMIASALFVCGGVVGGILNDWRALVPGLIFQVLAFVVWG